MVLRWLKFTCPTNKKTHACMGKEKSFRIGTKSNKKTSIGLGTKGYYCWRGNSHL